MAEAAAGRSVRPATGSGWAGLRYVPALVPLLGAAVQTYHMNRALGDNPYMDELFHIRQTKAYCAGRFRTWDPKITTPPGLYLLVAAATRVHNLTLGTTFADGPCSLTEARWINTVLFVFCLPITLWLIKDLRPCENESKKDDDKRQEGNDGPLKTIVHSCCLMVYPPFFLFCSMYYTDVGSVLAVLVSYLLLRRGCSVISALFGILALLFRQTNAVWLCFIAADHILSKYESGLLTQKSNLQPETLRPTEMSNLPKALFHLIAAVFHNLFSLLKYLLPHVLVVAGFILAVCINGSVALGDKENHQLTPHVAQMLYFAGSTVAFQSVWSIRTLKGGTDEFRSRWKHAQVSTVFKWIFIGILCSLAVLFITWRFTVVHPFLLADNRHYTFYIWKRILNGLNGRGRYLLAPGYVLAFYVLQKQMCESRIMQSRLRQLLLFGAVAVVLIPSPLFEFRYFITPFFMFYIHCCPEKNAVSGMLQLLLSTAICGAVFLVFLLKPFQWVDGTLARFMW